MVTSTVPPAGAVDGAWMGCPDCTASAEGLQAGGERAQRRRGMLCLLDASGEPWCSERAVGEVRHREASLSEPADAGPQHDVVGIVPLEVVQQPEAGGDQVLERRVGRERA